MYVFLNIRHKTNYDEAELLAAKALKKAPMNHKFFLNRIHKISTIANYSRLFNNFKVICFV